MNQAQNVQKNVKIVSGPEEIVGFFPNRGMGKHYDNTHCNKKQNSGQTCKWWNDESKIVLIWENTCYCLEQPKRNSWFIIRRKTHFVGETL